MHFVSKPHCSACEHFQACFYTDMVVEWGFCSLKAGHSPPSADEIERLKGEAEAGSQRGLLDRAGEIGLFVPNYTDCKDFSDFFPF